MSGPTRPRRRRISVAVAVAAVVVLAAGATAFFLLRRPPSSTVDVFPDRESQAIIAGGIVVDVPAGAVDGPGRLIVRATPVDGVPRGLRVGPMFEITLTGTRQVSPIRVTLPRPEGTGGQPVWLAEVEPGPAAPGERSPGVWHARPVTVDTGAGTVWAEVAHLRTVGVGWLDAEAIGAEAGRVFQSARGKDSPSAGVPQCPDADVVEKQGVKVDASGDATRWCTGLTSGRLTVRLVNARGYPLLVRYDDTAAFLGRHSDGLVSRFADQLGALGGLGQSSSVVIVNPGEQLEFGIDRILQGKTRFDFSTSPLASLAFALDTTVRMYATVAVDLSRIGVARLAASSSTVEDVAAGLDLNAACGSALQAASRATNLNNAFGDHLTALYGCLAPTLRTFATPVDNYFRDVVATAVGLPQSEFQAGTADVLQAARQNRGNDGQLTVTYPRLAASAQRGIQVSTGSPRHVLVMDISGSMAEKDGHGTVKIDGAKTAVETTLDAMPAAALVSLRTYPSPQSDCGSQLESGLTSPDDEALRARVKALKPAGDTPTGPALLDAVADLENAGFTPDSTIILVSDGESNCGPDPCEVAQGIAALGVAIVNTVGFNLSDAGRKQLECVSQATGGRYLDATDAEGLRAAISSATNPTLSVTLDSPRTASAGGVPAYAAGSAVNITVTVSNVSARVVNGATALLAFLPGDGNVDPGAAAPVRSIGNLQPGEHRQITWRYEAVAAQGQQSSFSVVAAATNAAPVRVSGTVRYAGALSIDFAGSLLRNATRVALVGDSFTAGEGAGGYRPAGTAADACHRSQNTYARQLFPSAPVVLACAGALVSHVTTAAPYGEPAQAAALAGLAERPDLVLATLGADDIGFADAFVACARTTSCQDSAAYPNPMLSQECLAGYHRAGAFEAAAGLAGRPAATVQAAVPQLPGCADFVVPFATMAYARVAELERSLPVAYRAIDAALNRDRDAKPIVVLAYPRLAPSRAENRGFCTGFDGAELDFLNSLTSRLNDTVAGAVDAARAVGVPVYYAGEVVDALSANHTICDRQPHVVVAGAGQPPAGAELMHPDADGYLDMTAALVRWSTTPGLRALTAAGERTSAGASAGRASVTIALTAVPPPAGAHVTAGTWVTATASGYAPGSRVTIWVQSVPQAVGTAVVGADGQVRAEILVPDDLGPGAHAMIAFGVSPSGSQWTFAMLDVRRPWPLWWFALSGLALLLLVVAALVWRRRRRTARADATVEGAVR